MAYALNLIRDAEIEASIAKIIRPLVRQAYGHQENIKTYLVVDPGFNAYVMGGRNIFLHTGLLLKIQTPEQLAGVLAHEMGHIQGGHLARSSQAMQESMLQGLLAGATIGAAALAVGGDSGGAIGGALLATQQVGIGSIQQYSRSQEASADQYATRLLTQTKIGSEGLLQVMQMLVQDEYGTIDYMRSHPLSQERIDLLSPHAHTHKLVKGSYFTPHDQHLYKRLQAKIAGFLEANKSAGKQDTYLNDPHEDVRVLYQASVLHTTGQSRKAFELMQAYVKKYPQDAYAYDLAAQIALETGFTTQARDDYAKAVMLCPKDNLLKFLYASSLLAVAESETSSPDYERALEILKMALQQEQDYAKGWFDLARVYDGLQKPYLAAAASAYYHHLRSESVLAVKQAKYALSGLPMGSREAILSEDILSLNKN